MSPSEASKRVAVIGMGSWGTALANVFADAGSSVTLWGRDEKSVKDLQETHRNEKYLKGIQLNSALKASPDLSEVLKKADVVVCSIPTQQIRNVFKSEASLLSGKIVVNSSKGIEIRTHKRVSEIFAEIAPKAIYSILSGPSFALETAKRLPTAVTIAAKDPAVAAEIQKLTATGYFRAYTSDDVTGVEFAGALKNVIAIASGMVVGLKLGYNAQAAIINRGIVEILKLGKCRSADPLTFMGLAGVGDLILTCTGPLSRNRKLGELLGEGKKFEEAKAQLGGIAEGYYTAHSAFELSQAYQIDTPIIREVYEILYQSKSPLEALKSLMSRELRQEW
jgi:glycerol-3-phosphate dehydrogenase (NAD(P)+)